MIDWTATILLGLVCVLLGVAGTLTVQSIRIAIIRWKLTALTEQPKMRGRRVL